MGNYDNEYKHYYRRVSEKSSFEDNQSINTNMDRNNYDEDLAYGYGYGQGSDEREDTGSIGIYFLKGLVGTTIFSLVLVGSVVGSKYLLGEKGIEFYSEVKTAIETDNYYKDDILAFINNAKKTADEELQSKDKDSEGKETAKDSLEGKGDIAVSSFQLKDSSIETKGAEGTGKFSLDSKFPIKEYKDVKSNGSSLEFSLAKGDVSTVLDGEVTEISEEKGNEYVAITHRDGIKSLYYNLEKVTVKKGDKLKTGDKIGTKDGKSDFILKVKEGEKEIDLKDYLAFNSKESN